MMCPTLYAKNDELLPSINNNKVKYLHWFSFTSKQNPHFCQQRFSTPNQQLKCLSWRQYCNLVLSFFICYETQSGQFQFIFKGICARLRNCAKSWKPAEKLFKSVGQTNLNIFFLYDYKRVVIVLSPPFQAH